jgi:hypothetical protein
MVWPGATNSRPHGWLISVKAPKARRPKLYVTVANTFDHALALVGDHCKVTNEKVEFIRVLTDEEIKQLGLKLGQVKLFA